MFEVGQHYEFEMKHGIEKDTLSFHHAEVVAWEPPLLNLRNEDGKEWVLNTNSSLFIRAKKEAPGPRMNWAEVMQRIDEEKEKEKTQSVSD